MEMGMRREPSGSEPVTARSALGARAILSGVALPLALIATVLLVVTAVRSGEGVWWAEAVITAVVAVIAAVDLVVIRKRMRARREREAARR